MEVDGDGEEGVSLWKYVSRNNTLILLLSSLVFNTEHIGPQFYSAQHISGLFGCASTPKDGF
jgi:hypothetical protein